MGGLASSVMLTSTNVPDRIHVMEVIKNVETSLDHMNVYADLDIKKTLGFAQVKQLFQSVLFSSPELKA